MSHTLEEQIDFMQSLMIEYSPSIDDAEDVGDTAGYKLSQSIRDTLTDLCHKRDSSELQIGMIRQYVRVTVTNGQTGWYCVFREYSYWTLDQATAVHSKLKRSVRTHSFRKERVIWDGKKWRQLGAEVKIRDLTTVQNIAKRKLKAVVNKPAPHNLKIGDYVFASRWSDCNPGDPWHIGHITEIGSTWVRIGEVSNRRFPYVMRITPAQGDRVASLFPLMEKENRKITNAELANVFHGVDEDLNAEIKKVEIKGEMP